MKTVKFSTVIDGRKLYFYAKEDPCDINMAITRLLEREAEKKKRPVSYCNTKREH